MDPLLNYNQLSKLLNVPVKTIQYWVYAKSIPRIKLGDGKKGTVRFMEDDIRKWVNMKRIV